MKEELKIKYLPIKQLKINPVNPRQITEEKYKSLVKSLEDCPSLFDARPCLCSDRTGELIVLGGNMRLRAAKELGYEQIPVIILSNLSEDQEKEITIKDNGSWGSWDMDLLFGWDDFPLIDWGVDLPEDWMCGGSEVSGLTDDDAIPEEVDPISKPGDLWLLGNHRVLCGDATKKEDVERVMDGEKADMVFTDPPYGVNYSGGVMTPRRKLKGDDGTALYGPCCKMAFRFTVVDAPLYLWHAGVKGIAAAAAAAAAAAGWEIRSELIWNKNQAQYGALSAQYKQKHEPCYYCYKRGASARWGGSTTEVSVWDIDRSVKNEYHPTQKPVALSERAINNHMVRIVLDFFLGSGSTLIACEKTGRVCYGIEIDPHYCDVIVKRWEDFTGETANKE